MSAAVSGDQYSAVWAEARRLIADGSETALALAKDHLSILDEMSPGNNAEFDVAVLRVEVAVLSGDLKMQQEGRAVLRAATPAELTASLRSVSDAALLGSPSFRRNLLEPIYRHLAPPDDLGIRYLDTSKPADARQLAAGEWQPPPELPRPLQREVRNWLAWHAIDAWLCDRAPEHLGILDSASWRSSRSDEKAWEQTLASAIGELAKSAEDKAYNLLGIVLRQTRDSPWAAETVRRMMTAYAPLALNLHGWSARCPDGLLRADEATDPLERVGASVAAVHRGDGEANEFPFDDAERSCWAAFAAFVLLPSGRVHDEVGRRLKNSIRQPSDAKRLPWPGREATFAESCMRLSDRALALGLLTAVLPAITHNSLRRACVSLLETAESEELASIHGSQLWKLLDDYVDELSAPRRQMVKRGCIYRAVIDGTNVAWGGLDGKAGGQCKLDRVKQVIRDLEDAGFTEIWIYFDRSTQSKVTATEWRWVEEMKVKYGASTPGYADPEIISTFLERATRSWIVTTDAYKDQQLRDRYPELLARLDKSKQWPASRLSFFLHQDGSLHFDARLDSPDPGKVKR